jgi:hypothetical protein
MVFRQGLCGRSAASERMRSNPFCAIAFALRCFTYCTHTAPILHPKAILIEIFGACVRLTYCFYGSPGRIRTADQRINSPSLYH